MTIPLVGPIAFALAMHGVSAGEVVRPFEVAPASESPECWASQETLPAMPVWWAVSLGPLRIHNVNTNAEATLSLYRTDGTLDPDALDEFSRIASGGVEGDSRETHILSTRTIQLAVKASYFFKGAAILAISSYRPAKDGHENHHSGGDALDFQLDGVKAGFLAAYLRREPRVGVGVYTHPRTQYVHLDLRDDGSYHWMDGSPPGVTWRETPLLDWTRWKKDPSYKPEMDLPALAATKK